MVGHLLRWPTTGTAKLTPGNATQVGFLLMWLELYSMDSLSQGWGELLKVEKLSQV